MGRVELSTKQADRGDCPFSSSSIVAPSASSLVVLSQNGDDDVLLPEKVNEGSNVTMSNNEEQIQTGARRGQIYCIVLHT